jgi:hypothetical protein
VPTIASPRVPKKKAIEEVDKMLWLIKDKTEGPPVFYPIFIVYTQIFSL